MDPKTISVTVNNDKERDFVCKWEERHGLEQVSFGEYSYPYEISMTTNSLYDKYSNFHSPLPGKTHLTFSSFIAQVEPQVGLPPEEKETTGEIVIGYKKIKDYPIVPHDEMEPFRIGEVGTEKSQFSWYAKWPEFWQPVYAPTKPKPITLFLGNRKREFRIEAGYVETKGCSENWFNINTDIQILKDAFGNQFVETVSYRNETFTRDDHEQLTKAIKDSK